MGRISWVAKPCNQYNGMKKVVSSRRWFLKSMILALPLVAVGAEGRLVEPTWLRVRQASIPDTKLGVRFVQISDLHHKGDLAYLRHIVALVNQLQPAFCCLTGDLVEEACFLPETLEALAGIRAPVFGVPGNHDYWSGVDFSMIRRSLRAGGGDWLLDEQCRVADGKIIITGSAGLNPSSIPAPNPGNTFNLLLMHYPAWVKHIGNRPYGLILAGHSHGGQVRLPLVGAPFLPDNVDGYELGFYETPAGLLYVNPGIGYIGIYHFRFNCRPEITLFEV